MTPLPADPTPAGAESPRGRFRFLASPGWIGAILAAIAFAVVCYTVLAPWQFGRHTGRAQQNEAITTAMSAPAVPVEELLGQSLSTPPAAHAWRLVTAEGSFLPGQVAVRLRQNQAGQASSEILAAFQLRSGAILLVDRGYVPSTQLSAGDALPPPPAGVQTLIARVQPFQPDPLHRAPVQIGSHTEVYGIDAGSITGLPGAPLPGFVQLTAESPGVFSAIGVPQTDPGPFYSYAWQWLIFGTMGLVAVGYFIFREATDPRAEREEDEPYDRSQLYDAPAERT